MNNYFFSIIIILLATIPRISYAINGYHLESSVKNEIISLKIDFTNKINNEQCAATKIGTGTVIHSSGYILTAAHIIKPNQTKYTKMYGKEEFEQNCLIIIQAFTGPANSSPKLGNAIKIKSIKEDICFAKEGNCEPKKQADVDTEKKHVYVDIEKDLSLLKFELQKSSQTISPPPTCNKYSKNGDFYAFGYAKIPDNRLKELQKTYISFETNKLMNYKEDEGRVNFSGLALEGMSGGPIYNERGSFVAMANKAFREQVVQGTKKEEIDSFIQSFHVLKKINELNNPQCLNFFNNDFFNKEFFYASNDISFGLSLATHRGKYNNKSNQKLVLFNIETSFYNFYPNGRFRKWTVSPLAFQLDFMLLKDAYATSPSYNHEFEYSKPIVFYSPRAQFSIGRNVEFYTTVGKPINNRGAYHIISVKDKTEIDANIKWLFKYGIKYKSNKLKFNVNYTHYHIDGSDLKSYGLGIEFPFFNFGKY